LNTVAGLRAPHAGEVLLQGKPVARWPLQQAARLRGLLPQVMHDAFSANALDVVLLGRHPYQERWAWESDADRAAALQALRDVDLEAFAERDVLSLSGGERQRVFLAWVRAPTLRLAY
jgi:iron complex transport system ATP-binding protein